MQSAAEMKFVLHTISTNHAAGQTSFVTFSCQACMIVCVQQCAAIEGDREDGLEIGCCCRAIEGGTALLSAIRSAAYVVYKRRQRGLHEPLGSSKGS